MSNSIDVSVPNVTQILCFFGHSMLNSNKVAVAVSLTFGSILANTLGATTGLVAASTAYLLTKYFHVKFENANAWKLQKETELNLIKAGAQFVHISELKAKISSLENGLATISSNI